MSEIFSGMNQKTPLSIRRSFVRHFASFDARRVVTARRRVSRSRETATNRTRARSLTRRRLADAVVVVQPYDCVEYVDAATGESKIAAVVGVSPDDATIVLRALVRSESEPRAFLCVDDDANDVVASSRCVSRVFKSDFSQRKADRRDDPHGEHAVDCWTVRDAVM